MLEHKFFLCEREFGMCATLSLDSLLFIQGFISNLIFYVARCQINFIDHDPNIYFRESTRMKHKISQLLLSDYMYCILVELFPPPDWNQCSVNLHNMANLPPYILLRFHTRDFFILRGGVTLDTIYSFRDRWLLFCNVCLCGYMQTSTGQQFLVQIQVENHFYLWSTPNRLSIYLSVISLFMLTSWRKFLVTELLITVARIVFCVTFSRRTNRSGDVYHLLMVDER